MMLQIEHYPHDDKETEDEHFAQVFAQAFINTNTVPTQELCDRWLREGFVDENELEMVLEAYEAIWQGGQ